MREKEDQPCLKKVSSAALNTGYCASRDDGELVYKLSTILAYKCIHMLKHTYTQVQELWPHCSE